MRDFSYAIGKACHVVWRDAYFDFDRNGGAESEREDFLVNTYGVVRAVGEQFTDVVSEQLPDGDERAITHIPTVLLVHVWVMEEVKTQPRVETLG
jgi:hypothetical protein